MTERLPWAVRLWLGPECWWLVGTPHKSCYGSFTGWHLPTASLVPYSEYLAYAEQHIWIDILLSDILVERVIPVVNREVPIVAIPYR